MCAEVLLTSHVPRPSLPRHRVPPIWRNSASLAVSGENQSYAIQSPTRNTSRLCRDSRYERAPISDLSLLPDSYVVATANSVAPDAEPTTTWHHVLSFIPQTNNYLRSLKKGSLVYVEANFEVRQPNPDADPSTPEGQRQIFLKHGMCFTSYLS